MQDEIPASRIMRERDDHKSAWALEFTRANALQEELIALKRALEDWRVIAIQNGEDLARSNVRAARLDIELSETATKLAVVSEDRAAWMKRSQENFARADRLAKYIGHVHENAGEDETWPHVRDLIEESGVDCDECRGDGVVLTFEDILVGDHHTTRDVTEECTQCSGIGKVLR